MTSPGSRQLDRQLALPRLRAARRLDEHLIVEADLPRDGRPFPVPYVLEYAVGPSGDRKLSRAHAGASAVETTGDGYVFLSNRKSERQREERHRGRSLWRARAGGNDAPELLVSCPRDVVSYAIAGDTVIAVTWLPAQGEHAPPTGRSVLLMSGDLWPRSSYQHDGHVLGLLHFRLGTEGTAKTAEGPPRCLGPQLDPDVKLTGELALTPDGEHCAAGAVRFLRGGHRRYGLLVFPLAAPSDAHPVWEEDDLTAPVAAPDGAWFACTAETVAVPGKAPKQGVTLVSADGRRVHRIAGYHDDWLQPRGWSAGGEIYCTGERDGRRRLWRVGAGDGTVHEIDLDGSVQSVVAAAPEAEVLVVLSAIDRPPELVSLRETSDGRHESATVLLAPARSAMPRGRMERLTYKALDGTAWHSWLCLPEDEDDPRPLPVLVWAHGGPMLSWTDWSWRWNPWPFVAEGYAVLMPDPPLSVGYGQAAVERGWGHWSSEVASVAAAQVRDAVQHPRLDANRMAAMGGSFGGFLALALAALLPEVSLVVSHAGWQDFAAVARASDLHWHWLREYGPLPPHGPYTAENLDLEAIGREVRVLLSHGWEDAHVPVGETIAMYRSLDTRGLEVELMLVPDEGHSITKPANVRAWYQWVLEACHATLGAQRDGKRVQRP
jgi:dipeptidyl aminopeptidase/acylaminoacyl peptidase